jgi:hypothetical protein
LWRAAEQEAASGSDNGGGSEEEADDGVTPELEGEEQGLTFEEISASHFGPMQDDETLSDYEERVSQGLASVRPSDYDRTEKAMLQALQQGHFYLEMKQMGLTALQVRTLLKGMAAKINETKAAFAYRYVNTSAVYVRVFGTCQYRKSSKAQRLVCPQATLRTSNRHPDLLGRELPPGGGSTSSELRWSNPLRFQLSMASVRRRRSVGKMKV